MCCPDYTSAWNKRKNLLLQNFTNKTVEKELILTKFALKLHPKSSETYSHRRWIFSKNWELNFIKKSSLNSQLGSVKSYFGENSRLESTEVKGGNAKSPVGAIESLLSMAHAEFQLCNEVARLQRSNYNAWAHKCWVINYVKSCVLKILDHKLSGKLDCVAISESFFHFLKSDILKMMTSLEKHVSDISMASSLLLSLSTLTEFTLLHNNGRRCFTSISNDDIIVIWIEVLHHNSRLLQLYDGHETLWRHRTNLFLCINKILHENVDIFENPKMKVFSLEQETRFCENFVKDEDENTFARSHVHCLNKFCK